MPHDPFGLFYRSFEDKIRQQLIDENLSDAGIPAAIQYFWQRQTNPSLRGTQRRGNPKRCSIY